MKKQNTKNQNAKKKAASGSRQKQSRRKQKRRRILLFLLGAAFAIVFTGIRYRQYQNRHGTHFGQAESDGKIPRPFLDVELLTVNEYSRPAIALEKIKGIVIHYTANPGTSAIANRNYFEGLKDSHITKASSHFVVGLEGEVVQCIPSSEIAYASNERNDDTLSIECCIEDETGKFSKPTYDAVVHLTAWLIEHFGLETENVIRHYDVTGKACPKYFVDHPAEWERFLADVQAYLVSYGVF